MLIIKLGIENPALLTKLACNVISIVQDHSVYVYQDNSGCSDRRIPFARLISKARCSPKLAVACLDFFFNNNPEGLYEHRIMYRAVPQEEEKGDGGLFAGMQGFAPHELVKNGKGRWRPKFTNRS